MSTEDKKHDPKEFHYIATNIFAPAYKVIAEQIVNKTGIKEGLCIDIGSSGGYLGFALSEKTDLNIYFLDILREATEMSQSRINSMEEKDRFLAINCDVHNMPFADNAFNLAISRGSVWFWDDPEKALCEILRVLKPGGYGYIGCGFGCEALAEEINEKMLQRDPDWKKKRGKPHGKGERHNLCELADRVFKDKEISYECTDDKKGNWLVFKK